MLTRVVTISLDDITKEFTVLDPTAHLELAIYFSSLIDEWQEQLDNKKTVPTPTKV